jgi:DNA polymerase I
MKKGKRLIVFDGNYMLQRALHTPVFQELTHNGKPTGGIFGTIRAISECLVKYPSRKCVMVWDGKRSERRMEMFPEYKANRRAKDAEERKAKKEFRALLRDQMKKLIKILPHLGVVNMRLPKREGDDLIYLIAKEWYRSGKQGAAKTVVVTEDKGLLQVVNKHVHVYQPSKKIFVSSANFKRVTGVPRCNYLLARAINGDSSGAYKNSDNIDGVYLVGEKGVRDLLQSEEKKLSIPKLTYLCEALGGAKLKRVAESSELLERNLELMDVKRERWTRSDQRFVQEALAETATPDIRAFGKKAKALGFESITSGLPYFFKPFQRLQ